MKDKKVLVTGGAGFIGSHLVDRLVESEADVVVYDDFSTGNTAFLKESIDRIRIVEGDILETAKLTKAMEQVHFVFHLAANADVRGGVANTHVDLQQNVIGTHSVLEAMRAQEVKHIAFASSAAVYGEPEVFPTPEDVSVIQTSVYGASKLAGEAYIQAFCEYYGMRSYIFRFVSWIGERYTHGVIYDFVKKLKNDPTRLEILGDGKQKKSYLYVKDGVDGVFQAIAGFEDTKNVFNLGHLDYLNVVDLAKIVIDEMDLEDVAFSFTGGKRGWLGDSPFVSLAIDKLSGIGWRPRTSQEEGIRKTVRYLLDHSDVMVR